MFARRALWLALVPLALPAAGHDAPAHGSNRESLVCGQPFDGLRSPDAYFMVASPREDTVPGSDGTFGQAVDASRIGVPGGAEWSAIELLDRGMLLVPWGFDRDCRPIMWTGSWRWTPPGGSKFYRGAVRSEDRWIAGTPTMDVYAAVWEGFPNSPWEHPLAIGETLLSADHLFELYAALPTPTDVAERPYGAVSDLVAWRRAAGTAAERYPARAMLESAFRLAETARVRKTAIPYAGTYGLVLAVGEDTLASLYLRTGQGGTGPLRQGSSAEEVDPVAPPAPTGAFVAPIALAASAAGLDVAGSTGRDSPCHRLMALRASESAQAGEDPARTWSAEVPAEFVAACFADVEGLAGLTSAGAGTLGVGNPFAGYFRREMDGRFTFRQPVLLRDGTKAVLEGERIGLETLRPIDPTARLDDLP